MFYHEARQRTHEVLDRLAATAITICGAGAVGANLCETLCRAGARQVTIIDRDRIEERNLSTQPWHRGDVGQQKARILANSLYRAVGVSIAAHAVELNADTVRKLLKNSDVVVDAFDNSTSRAVVTQHCADAHIPCLHVGMADGYAEILWNDVYRVPSDAHDDVCDYPLARTLVLLTVAVGAETIIRWVETRVTSNYTVTLDDLQIQPYQ